MQYGGAMALPRTPELLPLFSGEKSSRVNSVALPPCTPLLSLNLFLFLQTPSLWMPGLQPSCSHCLEHSSPPSVCWDDFADFAVSS